MDDVTKGKIGFYAAKKSKITRRSRTAKQRRRVRHKGNRGEQLQSAEAAVFHDHTTPTQAAGGGRSVRLGRSGADTLLRRYSHPE